MGEDGLGAVVRSGSRAWRGEAVRGVSGKQGLKRLSGATVCRGADGLGRLQGRAGASRARCCAAQEYGAAGPDRRRVRMMPVRLRRRCADAAGWGGEISLRGRADRPDPNENKGCQNWQPLFGRLRRNGRLVLELG